MEEELESPTRRSYDHLFKIIIIGDPCCGKTSMLSRICENKTVPNYLMTVGVDTKNRIMDYQGKKIKMQIWDTAGQERFRTLTTSYYRGTHCCVLLFDITNKDSFFHLFQWIDQYTYFCDFPITNIVIVANKHDEEDKREVS